MLAGRRGGVESEAQPAVEAEGVLGHGRRAVATLAGKLNAEVRAGGPKAGAGEFVTS